MFPKFALDTYSASCSGFERLSSRVHNTLVWSVAGLVGVESMVSMRIMEPQLNSLRPQRKMSSQCDCSLRAARVKRLLAAAPLQIRGAAHLPIRDSAQATHVNQDPQEMVRTSVAASQNGQAAVAIEETTRASPSSSTAQDTAPPALETAPTARKHRRRRGGRGQGGKGSKEKRIAAYETALRPQIATLPPGDYSIDVPRLPWATYFGSVSDAMRVAPEGPAVPAQICFFAPDHTRAASDTIHLSNSRTLTEDVPSAMSSTPLFQRLS